MIGLSAAYHLKQASPSLSILIVDQGAAPAQGDTAKSMAAVRDTFTSEVNRLLARSTIDFYRHVQSELGFNLNLELIGYLWLVTEAEFKRFETFMPDLRQHGSRFRSLERKDLMDLLPELVLDPASDQSKMMGLESVHKGVQALDAGIVAPERIAKFYETELKKLDVEFQFRTDVKALRLEPKIALGLPREPFVWQDKQFGGVETTSGSITADSIVLAAGARAPALLDPIGVDCLVKPKKRQVFQLRSPALEPLFTRKGFNDESTVPFTILPKGGVLLRPVRGEKSFWTASADDLGRPFAFQEEPAAEDNYYTFNIAPILTEYFPCFANLRPVNSWAGFYDINSLDSTPIIDRINNCIIATGMSGSGIMKADAVGRMVAAIYQGQAEATLYGNRSISTTRLGLTNRSVGKEEFVI